MRFPPYRRREPRDLRGLPRGAAPWGVHGAVGTVLAADVAVTSITTIMELRVPFEGWWLVFVHINYLRNSGTAHHANAAIYDSANALRMRASITQINATTNGWWYIMRFHDVLYLNANDLLLRVRGTNDGGFRSDAKANLTRMTAIPVVL